MAEKVIEITEDQLNEILMKSRKVREYTEGARITIGKNTLEFNGKVKIPGFNKKISILVELIDRDEKNVRFEIKYIKPSLFGLSKKLLSFIPPNRYVEIEDNKYLNVNLVNILTKVNYVESDNFVITDVRIEPGKISVTGKE